jgi:O-antigen/teichoic acid export membrane protein
MSVFTQLKQLSKDSLFYGLGNALQKFISFFLFPIYTRVLTQEDFGAQDLVLTASSIITYFLVLGLDSATARHYYDTDDPEEKKSILSTWIWFEVLISIPICFLLIYFAEPICALIFNNSSLAPYFRIGIATLPFTLISSVTSLALRLTFQSKTFSIIAAVGVLVQATAAILMVAILDLGITGVFLANLIAFIFRAILGLLFTYKHFHLTKLTLSFNWLKPMITYGLPLVPASLSLWILNYSNRYFLARLATLSDIGLLGIGNRISSIASFVISAFQIAWGPFAFSLIKDTKLAKDTYAKVLSYFLLVSLFITVGLSLFGREAILILATPDYEKSAVLVPWLSLGSVAWGVVYIVGIGAGIAKKSYHTTISTVIAASINIGLNFLLIPKFGITGAAASTMIGHMAALFYRYFVGQHYFYVDYEFRRIFSLIGISVIFIIIGAFTDQALPVWSPVILLYKLIAFSSYIGSMFIFRIITRQEANLLLGYVTTRFARSGVE